VIKFISASGKSPKVPIRYDSFKNVAVDEKAMLHPQRYECIAHISLGETKLLNFSNSFLHETLDAKVITAIFFLTNQKIMFSRK
jgi:hypothetical protein